ncbi:hypothetical protein DUF364 [Gottschalkia acidurici 9a]|uniref:DUF364 domain-containing protein n=1 Tax=Gottschalkia acidurici (strain ATCC 7906 / DSM 604 / BCRC 14475 / CIP 104303 / KCTC 5404 / NCIMB 10678 / 9a) TaxID=1128398 RepID=K0AWA0_GOTA9|nr:DUF364 domain-containing protein [Gottschalkia acidurici]AFS77494.1 hypothetical protein DUF364 [Gottschalkia acidurici 9a]
MIIDELIKVALESCGNKKVADLRLGLGYTGVLLDDNSCGLAYTFRSELGSCCSVFGQAGKMKGRSAEELILWGRDENLAKSTIGIATINAIINSKIDVIEKSGIVDLIDVKENERFGMVGNFKPILKEVKKRTENIYIFERQKTDNPEIYPESAMDEYLTKCDVVLITATSIINKTIDEVLKKTKNAREVYIVGSSTPLCPEVFKKYGVSVLAGAIVRKPLELLDIISQGGGTRAMKGAIDQVNLKI